MKPKCEPDAKPEPTSTSEVVAPTAPRIPTDRVEVVVPRLTDAEKIRFVQFQWDTEDVKDEDVKEEESDASLRLEQSHRDPSVKQELEVDQEPEVINLDEFDDGDDTYETQRGQDENSRDYLDRQKVETDPEVIDVDELVDDDTRIEKLAKGIKSVSGYFIFIT